MRMMRFQELAQLASFRKTGVQIGPNVSMREKEQLADAA